MNFFHNSLKIVNMAQRYNEILYRYITQCTFSIDSLEQMDPRAAVLYLRSRWNTTRTTDKMPETRSMSN